jgi:hypothetical protein
MLAEAVSSRQKAQDDKHNAKSSGDQSRKTAVFRLLHPEAQGPDRDEESAAHERDGCHELSPL